MLVDTNFINFSIKNKIDLVSVSQYAESCLGFTPRVGMSTRVFIRAPHFEVHTYPPGSMHTHLHLSRPTCISSAEPGSTIIARHSTTLVPLTPSAPYFIHTPQVRGMMDCLYAECKPCITDCVMAELEKLGQKYRVALKVAKVRV